MLFPIGIGLSAYGLVMLVFSSLQNKQVVKVATAKTTKEELISDFKKLAASILGALTMLLLSLGSGLRIVIISASVGGILGLLLYSFFQRMLKDAEENQRRRDVILLFEIVEMYMKAGMSMNYAMEAAKRVVPNLSCAIEKSLTYWPTNSNTALEILQKELKISEADILVSILRQINRVGIRGLNEVIHSETQSMEKLREALIRSKIITRPIYFVIYRVLPLIAVFGLIAGSLFWRLKDVFNSIGISF